MAGPWAVAVTLGGGTPLGVQDGCGGLHLTPESPRACGAGCSRGGPVLLPGPPQQWPLASPRGPGRLPCSPGCVRPPRFPRAVSVRPPWSSPWNRPPPSPSLGPGSLQAPRAVVSGREPWSVGLALGFPLPPVQLLRFALRLRGPSILPRQWEAPRGGVLSSFTALRSGFRPHSRPASLFLLLCPVTGRLFVPSLESEVFCQRSVDALC